MIKDKNIFLRVFALVCVCVLVMGGVYATDIIYSYVKQNDGSYKFFLNDEEVDAGLNTVLTVQLNKGNPGNSGTIVVSVDNSYPVYKTDPAPTTEMFGSDYDTSKKLADNFLEDYESPTFRKKGDFVVVTDDKGKETLREIVNVDGDGVYTLSGGDDQPYDSYHDDDINNDRTSSIKNCLNEPSECTKENRALIKNNPNIDYTDNGYLDLMKHNTDIDKKITDLETKRDNCNDEACKKDANAQIKALEEDKIDGVEITNDKIGNILNNPKLDLDDEEIKSLVGQAQKNNCAGYIWETGCQALDFTNAQDLKDQAAYKKFSSLLNANINKDGTWKKTSDEMNAMIDKALQDSTKSFKDTKLQNYDQFKKDNNGCDSSKDDSCIEQYKDYLDNYEGCANAGEKEGACRDALGTNLAMTDAANKKTSSDYTQWKYNALTSLITPDKNAKEAAKLFGFEADYTSVPSWLKNDVASSICVAKINGYLDDTNSYAGGITSYGSECDDYDKTKSTKGGNDLNCAHVISDLRAQRTRITPDNKTVLTYSYYLKGPKSSTAQYLIAVSYKESGSTKKIPLFDEIKNVTKKAVATGFDTVELNFSSRDAIDENSFQVTIGAFVGKSPYVLDSVPVVPISQGNTFTPIASSSSNSSVPGSSGTGLTTNDMIDLMG